MKNINIPPFSVKEIGQFAFSRCTSLTNMILPYYLESIEDYVFQDCSSLSDVYFPISITSIGSGAFYDCRSLNNIEFRGRVARIGEYAFSGCRSLTSIDIPNLLTKIEDGVFSGCSSLSNVYLFSHTGIESIGEKAFYGCSSLNYIYIPQNVEEIGAFAFFGCKSLISVICQKYRPSELHPYAFDDEQYKNTTLYVYNDAYRSATGWKQFVHIMYYNPDAPLGPLDIGDITTDASNPATIYNLNGRRVREIKKGGVYIFRHADGTTYKKMVK